MKLLKVLFVFFLAFSISSLSAQEGGLKTLQNVEIKKVTTIPIEFVVTENFGSSRTLYVQIIRIEIKKIDRRVGGKQPIRRLPINYYLLWPGVSSLQEGMNISSMYIDFFPTFRFRDFNPWGLIKKFYNEGQFKNEKDIQITHDTIIFGQGIIKRIEDVSYSNIR
jgi:hypothetical protein